MPEYVVWSFEHKAWWATNSCGYVTNILAAGLYTEHEAKEIEEGANRHSKIPKEKAILAETALEDEIKRVTRRGESVGKMVMRWADEGRS